MNPGTRPRTGIAVAIVAVLAVAVVSLAVVASTPDEAEASGLETFASCQELSAWGERHGTVAFNTVGGGVDMAEPVSESAFSADDAGATRSSLDGATGTGATNVVVEGVDELDLVDRLDERRLLAVSPELLAVVDLEAGAIVASVPVEPGAEVTYDPDAGVAWVVAGVGVVGLRGGVDVGEPGITEPGFAGVSVERVAVGEDALRVEGRWTSEGALVDARRVGDELFVVASDGFGPIDDQPIPFEGGPVPCTDVLHPPGQSDPTATLITALPATGEVEPVRASQVVGSGRLVHVTTDAAYLATPRWDTATPTTMIHRFELDSLTHTGSGQVGGTLLNDFSMSEHDGHLRVAITAQGASPIPFTEELPFIDEGPDIVEDVAPVPPPEQNAETLPESTPTEPEVNLEPAPEPTTIPETPTTVPDSTPTTAPASTTTRPDPTTTVPETTTTVAETTTTVAETTTTTTEAPPEPQPQPGPDEGLNQVVVLDTDGDLDVVGRSPWFGLPGETLHGIRFEGTTAYAVTFLQTDPFYVLDLADPTQPRILGEVKLPGFSAYLHPVAPGKVVGFGPDENGQASAKLFDVSDPASPQVVDSLELGSESAVVADHHAYVDLGEGRFAVPATDWIETYPDRCTPTVRQQAQERAAEIEAVVSDPTIDLSSSDPEIDRLFEELQELESAGCLYPGSTSESVVIEVEVVGDELREVLRWAAEPMAQVQRVIPTNGGWALLGWDELVILDGPDDERARLVLR